VDEVDLIKWLKKTLEFFPEYAPEPYNLPAKGWGIEKNRFPLFFAPSLPYKGIADARFMNGFGTAGSDEFWSYCFLWYLDGTIKFTESSLKNDLETYYNGLNAANVTTATVKNVKQNNSYEQSFECVIKTYDKFVTHKQVILNGTVNIKKCAPDNKTIVFFEISPQPFSSMVWQKLNVILDGVGCNK
jgi:hypothetical protein